MLGRHRRLTTPGPEPIAARRDRLVGRTATAVTVGCLALVACTAVALAVPAVRGALGFKTASSPAYVVGDRIDVAPALYAASPQTLLILTRSTCGACQSASLAFGRLVAKLAADPTVQVALVVRDADHAGERQYARGIGLDDRHLTSVDFAKLRLRRVPTIVLVNQRGEVRYSLEGAPSELQEEELLDIVASFNPLR